ncbi:rho-associated coiled-coil containing kinase [Tubulinosema ratisbonensis]|uniref:non-specific serine/threonine protein kinase n=1 Tax=Tubulinosema ratisbonensis TaxID=291195 RepID=A0A437AKJ1_9MICR|nr:rho-associated coiled-coil containing kinase [Tubulinosema ratisbonensis]
MSKTKDEENSNKVERISTLFDCLDSTYFTTNSNKLIDLHLDPRRTRLSDFKVISLLSKGAFGEVYLVSKDDKPYALKRVLKETVNRQPSTALHMEEREILIKARESNFLVFAHCTFQDEGAIYFLMEYFPGGDFTNLLSNYGMEENQIRFYGAEILLALKELHSFNFVHRDLKPENLLITKEGHIKLCDFGSCAMLKDGKIKCDVTIGTPDYVSPEVLCSAEKMSEYGTEVDLWTFGTLLYEMVNEEPPFFSELLEETYERIKEISFTHENGSKELKDLIDNLLVKKENRFTIQQVMDHPFFKGIDFDNIYKSTPPRVPKISSIFDVSNFPEANRNICIVKSDKIDYKSFIGFSYDPFFTNEFIKEITLQNFSEEKKITESNFKEILSEKDKAINDLINNSSDTTLEVLGKEKYLLKEEINKLNKKLEENKQKYEICQQKFNDLSNEVNQNNSDEIFFLKNKVEELKDVILEKEKLINELKEVSKENNVCELLEKIKKKDSYIQQLNERADRLKTALIKLKESKKAEGM